MITWARLLAGVAAFFGMISKWAIGIVAYRSGKGAVENEAKDAIIKQIKVKDEERRRARDEPNPFDGLRDLKRSRSGDNN